MTSTFDGFFLPELAHGAIREWGSLQSGDLHVRYPILSANQIDGIWTQLSQHRRRMLVRLPVAEIAQAIGKATALLRTESDETIRLVSAATGYSTPVVAETLDHMFADWSEGALLEMLASELDDARVLDHAIPDPHISGKQIAAYGYDKAFHVFSGNVPGVGVTSLIRSLLVKSATLCKTASGEPVLPILFARALQQVAPEIASCIALAYWPHDSETQTCAVAGADVVVVYGGELAVTGVREQARSDAHIVTHGPRVSFGLVGPDAHSETPRSVATAVAAYDQQGCVSPHVVYVVGSPERARSFARDVAQHLHDLGRTHPRGNIIPEEAVAIRNARTAAEFAPSTEIFGSDGDNFSVIFDVAPTFEISCLNRVLFVKPLPAAAQVLDVLPRARLLQSAAVDGFPENQKAEMVRLLGLAGVSRITSFARLPWPPMHWHHDGGAPLRELLWWQDVEG